METDSSDSIHVEELELFAHIGVTGNERSKPQRIILSITVWPTAKFEEMHDDITRTINYSDLCVTTREFVGNRSDKLIESLASELASHLLQAFPIHKIQIELRKFVLPDAEYASVTIVRAAVS